MSTEARDPAAVPLLSVIIPVYNEEESLPLLFSRLMPVLENLERPYEVVFVNDGRQTITDRFYRGGGSLKWSATARGGKAVMNLTAWPMRSMGSRE